MNLGIYQLANNNETSLKELSCLCIILGYLAFH